MSKDKNLKILMILLTILSIASGRFRTSEKRQLTFGGTCKTDLDKIAALTNKVKYAATTDGAATDVAGLVTVAAKTNGTNVCCVDGTDTIVQYTEDLNISAAKTSFACVNSGTSCRYQSSGSQGVFFRIFLKNDTTVSYVDYDKVCLPVCPVTVFTPIALNTTDANKTNYILHTVSGNKTCVQCDGSTFEQSTCSIKGDQTGNPIKKGNYTGNGVGLLLNCKKLAMIAEINPASITAVSISNTTAVGDALHICVHRQDIHLKVEMRHKQIYNLINIGSDIDDTYYVKKADFKFQDIATNVPKINTIVGTNYFYNFPFIKYANAAADSEPERMDFCTGYGEVLRTGGDKTIFTLTVANTNTFDANVKASLIPNYCSDTTTGSTNVTEDCTGDKIYVYNAQNFADRVAATFIEMPNICVTDYASAKNYAQLLKGETADGTYPSDFQIVNKFVQGSSGAPGKNYREINLDVLWGVSCPAHAKYEDADKPKECVPVGRCKKIGTANYDFFTTATSSTTGYSEDACFSTKVCQASAGTATQKVVRVEVLYVADDSDAATTFDDKYYFTAEGGATETPNANDFTFSETKANLRCSSSTFDSSLIYHVKPTILANHTKIDPKFKIFATAHSAEDFVLEVYKAGSPITKCKDIGMYKDERTQGTLLQTCVTAAGCNLKAGDVASNGATKTGFLSESTDENHCYDNCSDVNEYFLEVKYNSSTDPKITLTCSTGFNGIDKTKYYKFIGAHKTSTKFTQGSTELTISSFVQADYNDVYIYRLNKQDEADNLGLLTSSPLFTIDPTGATGTGASGTTAKHVLKVDGEFDVINSDFGTAATCHGKTTNALNPYVTASVNSGADALICAECKAYKTAPTSDGDKFLLMTYNANGNTEAKISIECATYSAATHGNLRFTTIEKAIDANVATTNNILKTLNGISTTFYPNGFTVFIAGTETRCADIATGMFTEIPSFDAGSKLCEFKGNCKTATKKVYEPSTGEHKCTTNCKDITEGGNALFSNTPITAGTYTDMFECGICNTSLPGVETKTGQEMAADGNNTSGTHYLVNSTSEQYCIDETLTRITPPTDASFEYSFSLNNDSSPKKINECWQLNYSFPGGNSNFDPYYIERADTSCNTKCKTGTTRIPAFANSLAPWQLYCVPNCNGGFPLKFNDKVPFSLKNINLDNMLTTGDSAGKTVAQFVTDNIDTKADKTLREILGKDGIFVQDTDFCFFNFDTNNALDYSIVQCPEGLLKFHDTTNSKYECITEGECSAKSAGTAAEKTFYKKATLTKTVTYSGTTAKGFTADANQAKTYTYSICVEKCSSISLSADITNHTNAKHASRLTAAGALDTTSTPAITGMFAYYNNNSSTVQECFSNLKNDGASVLDAADQKNCFYTANAATEKPAYSGANIIADGDSWCFDKGVNFCPTGKRLIDDNKSTVFSDFCVDACAYSTSATEFKNGSACVTSCSGATPAKVGAVSEITANSTFEFSCIADEAACKTPGTRSNYNLFLTKADLEATGGDSDKLADLIAADADANLINGKLLLNKLSTEAKVVSGGAPYESICITTKLTFNDIKNPSTLKIPKFNGKILKIDKDNKYMEFITESTCAATGATPTEHLYKATANVNYCLTSATCNSLTTRMTKETESSKSFCVDEASCLLKLTFNDTPDPKEISVLPKKKGNGPTAQCVTSCNSANANFYSNIPASLTTLATCIDDTTPNKFGTCTTANADSNGCLELTEFYRNLKITIASVEYVYTGTAANKDLYLNSAGTCNPTTVTKLKAHAFNGSKKANVCKVTCSQSSEDNIIKKLTYIDGDANSAKDQCLVSCSVAANTPGGTTIKFIKGVKNQIDQKFLDLECVGDQDSAYTTTVDLICATKATKVNLDLFNTTDNKFQSMFNSSRADFFGTLATTDVFCFEAGIDGASCTTGGTIHYLDDTDLINSSSTKKAYSCVNDKAACGGIATKLILVNTMQIAAAGDKVCTTTCTGHQAAVTDATASYVLSNETTNLAPNTTVGPRDCITDKEMKDDTGNFHYFVFDTLKIGSATEAGITDTTIADANKLAIKVANTVLKCPSGHYTVVIQANKLFRCVKHCADTNHYGHEVNGDINCLTEDQCYALPFEGTGTAQKIYKPFIDDDTPASKRCVHTCPKTDSGPKTFPSFKFTKGTPNVIELGPCKPQAEDTDFPMLNIFSEEGFEAKGASVKKGPNGTTVAATDANTAIITHNQVYKGQFTDDATNKYGCVDETKLATRLFTKVKIDQNVFSGNVGFPCVTHAKCGLTLGETNLATNYDITDPNLKIAFLSSDKKSCIKKCDSTATPSKFVHFETKTDTGNEGKHNIAGKEMICKEKTAGKKTIELTATQMVGFYFYEEETGATPDTDFKIASGDTGNYDTANIKFALIEGDGTKIPTCPKVTATDQNIAIEAGDGTLTCGDTAACLDASAIFATDSDIVCSKAATDACVPTDFENDFKVVKYTSALGYFKCIDFASTFTGGVADNTYFIDYLTLDGSGDTTPTGALTITGIATGPNVGTNKFPAGVDQNGNFNAASTKMLFLFEADTVNTFNFANTNDIAASGAAALNTYPKLDAKIPTRGGMNLCKYLSSTNYRYKREYNCNDHDSDVNTACIPEIKESCGKVTTADKQNLMELEVTITANQASYASTVNTPGKRFYVDKYACADLNNNPSGASFKIYARAPDGVKICSDIVTNTADMRQVGNYIYDKALISSANYVGCVAENMTTDVANNDCLEYLKVLNKEIATNVNITADPFKINAEYQTKIADKRGTTFIEEQGKFLKIVGTDTEAGFVAQATCDGTTSCYVNQDACDGTAAAGATDYVLLPDLTGDSKRIHSCVTSDSTNEGKHFFKTDNEKIFQLDKEDTTNKTFILAEDAPFLQGFGAPKVTSNALEKKLLYTENSLNLPHGHGATDAAKLASTVVGVQTNLAGGNQSAFTTKSISDTITATNTQYIIQKIDNTTNTEKYELVDSNTVPTECANMYQIIVTGINPILCLHIWTTRTPFAGVLAPNSAFKFTSDATKPLELTVEARVDPQITEGTTGIKIDNIATALNYGFSIDYENKKAYKGGCPDPTKLVIRAIKDGVMQEICGSEERDSSTQVLNHSNVFTKYIQPVGYTGAGSTTFADEAAMLAKMMLVIGTDTTTPTMTYYFEENADFSSLDFDKRFYWENDVNKLPGTLKDHDAISGKTFGGGFYVDVNHCTDNKKLGITGQAKKYPIVCLDKLETAEKDKYSMPYSTIKNPDKTADSKVNPSGCGRAYRYINFSAPRDNASQTCEELTSDIAVTNFEMGYKFGPDYCKTDLATAKAVHVAERVSNGSGGTQINYVCRVILSKITLPMMLQEIYDTNNNITKYAAIRQEECLAMPDYSFVKIHNYFVCRKRSKCKADGHFLIDVKDANNKVVAHFCVDSCTGSFEKINFPLTTTSSVNLSASTKTKILTRLDGNDYCVASCPSDSIMEGATGSTGIEPSALTVDKCHEVARGTNADLSDLMTVTKVGNLKLDIFNVGVDYESVNAAHKTHVLIDHKPGSIKKVFLVTAADCLKVTDFVVKSVTAQGGTDRSGTAVTNKTVKYCISKPQCMELTTDAGNNYINEAGNECIVAASNICYKQAAEVENLAGGIKQQVNTATCHSADNTVGYPCGAGLTRFPPASSSVYFCKPENECNKTPDYIQNNGHCTLLADTNCSTNINKDNDGKYSCAASLPSEYAVGSANGKTVNYSFSACINDYKWLARDGNAVGECKDTLAEAKAVTNMKFCILHHSECNSDITKLRLTEFEGTFLKEGSHYVGYDFLEADEKFTFGMFAHTQTTGQLFYMTMEDIINFQTGTDKLYFNFQNFASNKTALGACTAPFFQTTIPAGNIYSYGGEIEMCVDRDICYNKNGVGSLFGDWSFYYYIEPNNTNPKCGISCEAIDALISAPAEDKTFLLMDGTTDQNKICLKRTECRDKGFYINMRQKGTTKTYEEFECNMQCSTHVFHEPCVPGSTHTGIRACPSGITDVTDNKRCFPSDTSINEDTTYRIVNPTGECTNPEKTVSILENCMMKTATKECLTDLSKPLCPDKFFEKSNREIIEVDNCDEQPTGTTANATPKMPSFERKKNICYKLPECSAEQYIYIDYNADAILDGDDATQRAARGKGKGTTHLKCGDFCIRRHVFVNDSAIPGLTTKKFCVDDCHDLERLRDLHITNLGVEPFETQFNTNKMIGECEAVSCPSGSMLTTTNEEYKYCSTDYTAANKICGYFLGNLLNTDAGTGSETCIKRTDCKCTLDSCTHMFNPNLNTCTTKQKCLDDKKRLSLTDNGELVCLEVTTAKPHNLFINGSHFECNRYGTSTPHVWVQPESNDLDQDSECITRDKCIKDKRFLTLDGRCVTEAQCFNSEATRGQLGLKLLFGEADSQYCVTDLQCSTFKRNDSTSLVPRPANYLVENSNPTCFNCFANEFYIPSIYFTKPIGTCAERCVGNPDLTACQTTCASTDYVPSFNCVTACPSGFWQKNTEMVCQPFCQNFLDEAQKVCQDTCQSRHVKKSTTSDHYICLSNRSCGNLLKMDSTVTYKSSSICVTECPVFYRKTTTNMCVSCSTLFYDDQCNPAIPDGLVETKDTTVSDSCSTCTTLKKCVDINPAKKYYYKEKCYSATELNLADKVQLNDEFHRVVDCGYKDETGIDSETQTCVTKCPKENQGFFNGVCKDCVKEGNSYPCYIDGRVFKPSATCPAGMSRNPSKPYFCVTAEQANQLQAAECKGLNVFDKELNQCVSCDKTGTQVIVNEQCVNSCGIKKKKVLKANNTLGKNICEDCPAYSDSNNCLDKCPGEQIISPEGKCEPCPAQDSQGNTLKFVNGECKKICSTTSTSNCISESAAQEGATCTGCIDCNGQTATLSGGVYSCVCLGELKGKNCRTSPQTAEAIATKSSEDLTKTIPDNLPLTPEVKTQAQTMIETAFENMTATISAENASTVEQGFTSPIIKLETFASTVDSTNFTASEEELNNIVALADSVMNGINNFTKVNQTANRLRQANGNRLLQSTTVQMSAIFQSVMAKAKAAIRSWVNAYANKPTLTLALSSLSFSSFKAHFFPLSKDRATKLSTINRLEELNIPVVGVDACVDSVMSEEGVYPIIAIVIFNQTITDLNNSKSYETFVYSNKTKKQVDCSAFTNSIQIDSETITKLNRVKSKVLEVKKTNDVDLLNRNSGFYEDRCQKYALNGFIFTPKMKRNILFPKLKVECSDGCKFVGMTDNYKAICECFNQNAVVLKTQEEEMDASKSTADYPGEVVKCNLWLDSVNDWYRNYALYLLAGISLFTVVLFTIKIIQDEVNQMNSSKYKIFRDRNEFLAIGATNEGRTKLKVEERDSSRENDKESDGQMISRFESKNGDADSQMMDNKSENSISIKKSPEITSCQLDHHSALEVLEHDNRTFVTYLGYVLSTQNVILSPFLAYSLIKPFFVRVYDLMVYLLLVPFFVTVFTWDEHIEAIYEHKGETALGQTFNQFKHGWDRVIYGIIATFIVRLFLHKIVTPSDKVLLHLGRGFAGAGEMVVSEYNQYKRMIAIRLGFYFFFATTLSLVAIYYCLAYVDFYNELNSNWLIAVSVAIGAGVIFQALLQVLHVCVWAIAKRVGFMKYAFAFSRFLAI